MVHSEQMLPLGTSPKTVESLRLVGDDKSGYSISNTTDLVLRDLGVFRRAAPAPDEKPNIAPRLEAAYVSKLDAASSAILRFEPLTPSERPRRDPTTNDNSPSRPQGDSPRTQDRPSIWLDAWNKVPIFALPGSAAESEKLLGNDARIRLTRLARLAADQLRLLPGDVRLVGWTDQPLSGLRIRPEAPQNRTYTLVLAHLSRGQLHPPKPDANVAEDFLDPTLLDSESDPQGGTP
jgi:hypothetical protein